MANWKSKPRRTEEQKREYLRQWRLRNSDKIKGYSIRTRGRYNTPCPDCGKLKSKNAKRCRSCKDKVFRGSAHPEWEGGDRPFACRDCGAGIFKNNKSGRCKKCWGISVRGIGNVAWKGGKPDCIDCGKKVRLTSAKRCWKCSHERQIGAGNPNWKNGKSHEQYPEEFNEKLKEKIRIRDGRLCQECGSVEKNEKHHVHHIDYNKRNLDETNLISLCRPCHLLTNGRRSIWEEKFTRMMEAKLAENV